MLKKYYRFDNDSLNYKKPKPGLKQKINSAMQFFAISLALAAIIITSIVWSLGWPKLNHLQEEKSEMFNQYTELEKEFNRVESKLNEISKRDDSLYRVITESEPIPKSVRESGFGGSEVYKKYENFENANLLVEAAKKIDKLSKKAYIQSKSYDELLAMAKERKKRLIYFPAISPIPKEDVAYISDYFGYRMHPVHKKRLFHWGVDLSADVGTPIHAPANGVVEELNYASYGFGKLLTIDHGYGLKTLYGHLSRFNVTQGQVVKRGDTIAFVGNAGITSGPHLHYGMVKDGKKINPFNFFTLDIPKDEYEQIIAQSNDGH